jgi:putative transposase
MKKSRSAEEQIISFKQAEAGMPIKELCRKGGFGDATFYKWRAKFGGMDVPDAKRLRELESENAKLKKMLAEAHLDMHALKSVLGVKRYRPHPWPFGGLSLFRPEFSVHARRVRAPQCQLTGQPEVPPDCCSPAGRSGTAPS